MALAPRSPSRRSLRVASQYAHDPYPLAPLLADELPPPPTIRSVLLFTYLSFLSRRHLHRYVLYLALACLASAWFFSLEIAVLSVPSLAWFFFLRPKIHVHRQAEGREFLWTTGTRGTKNINMAAAGTQPWCHCHKATCCDANVNSKIIASESTVGSPGRGGVHMAALQPRRRGRSESESEWI